MIYKVPYTCKGFENQDISIPALTGKDIICILVNGLNRKILSVNPESDNNVEFNINTGMITLNYIPQKGTNILVLYRNRDILGDTRIPMFDFSEDDFASEDFY